MKPSSVMTAALSGLVVYLLLQIVFGMYGVIATGVMTEYLEASRRDLLDAQEQRVRFQQEIESLTTDEERIRIEARAIGMVDDTDVVVRVNGYQRAPRYSYDPGVLPVEIPWPRDNRPLFRSIGLATALLVMLLYLLRVPQSVPPPRRARDEEWDVEIGTG